MSGRRPPWPRPRPTRAELAGTALLNERLTGRRRMTVDEMIASQAPLSLGGQEIADGMNVADPLDSLTLEGRADEH